MAYHVPPVWKSGGWHVPLSPTKLRPSVLTVRTHKWYEIRESLGRTALLSITLIACVDLSMWCGAYLFGCVNLSIPQGRILSGRKAGTMSRAPKSPQNVASISFNTVA